MRINKKESEVGRWQCPAAPFSLIQTRPRTPIGWPLYFLGCVQTILDETSALQMKTLLAFKTVICPPYPSFSGTERVTVCLVSHQTVTAVQRPRGRHHTSANPRTQPGNPACSSVRRGSSAGPRGPMSLPMNSASPHPVVLHLS